MGFFSDAKAVFDVQRIKTGKGTAKLSISQIVNLLINLPDAQKKLSADEFNQVYILFKEMRKCKTKLLLNMDGYVDTAIKIIKEFDKIAPYEKYSGGNEIEFSFMMADIRGENYEEIQSLKKLIAEAETALQESIKEEPKQRRILEDAYSDEDLQQMVLCGEFPADKVEEYRTNREALAVAVRHSPRFIEVQRDAIASMKAQLYELEHK